MTTTTIFLVEDEKIIAKGIEKQLKGLGYAVAGAASTGVEAIERAVLCQPDMVLMDINLGSGIDGVEAARQIRARIDVPVIYLTAHSDTATLQRAKLTEPFGYVLKPYEDKDLQTAIEIGLYRHKMERRLRENEQWLAATLASIGDGLTATDELGRVRLMNTLAERLTGWAHADARNRDVNEVLPLVDEASRQPLPNPALEALTKGVPVNLTSTLLIDKTGVERPVDSSAAPIQDVNGKVAGSVIVFRDVTDRRRREEQLRQAQKMEAIGRLASGIAHNFNNIMTVISGFSELLLADGISALDRQMFARNIHEASKRAATLTQQISTFAGRPALAPCPFNLNAVVRDLVGMVKWLLGPNIELVIETASDFGAVTADPTQIGQALLNLATNARDAMPNGGRLVVATALAQREHDTTTHAENRYAMLSVTDTGCGMSAEVLPHIFEPFFTTRELGKGTGLGLATVYGIVTQNGGHIDVSSKVGLGTTFRIYLPLLPAPAAPAASPDPRMLVQGHETILLLEDEDMVRQMTRTVLQQDGYMVLDASNDADALALFQAHQDKIHLLLTDLTSPRLSGRRIAQQFQGHKADLRVIFMSAFTEDVTVQDGVASIHFGSATRPTVEFLPKPFSPAALKQKVRDVLDRR
jgi:PAS domain S-box-containing protein